jgi:hypothetical protein
MVTKTGPELVGDLEDQLRSHVIAKMGDASGELTAMTTVALLTRWFNWRDRIVPRQPRTVHESKELVASPAAQDHARELAQINHEITTGVDLTPRLSNRARESYTPVHQRRGLHQRPDLDLLLSDWGIHHLHLVPAPARSDLLLFAVFRPADAYLLQLLPHGNWTDQTLIEIIVRNWPSAGLVMGSLKGGIGLAQKFSDAEHQQLRQGGVSTLMEVDGTVYIPRGMSTAGTAIDVTRRADQIMQTLQAYKSELKSDTAPLDDLVRRQDHALAHTGAWHIYLDAGEFGFVEEAARLRIPVVQLNA